MVDEAAVAGVQQAQPPPGRDSFRANAFALALGQGTTWTLSLLAFTLLPRHLGPGGMGQLGVGLAFATVFVVVGRAGFHTLLTREIAQDPGRARQALSSLLVIGFVLGVLASLASIAIAWLAGYGAETVTVVAIMCAAVPVGIVTSLAFAAFQGLERMRYQAAVDVAHKAMLFGGFMLVIVVAGGVVSAAVAYMATALLTGVGAVWLLHRIYPLPAGRQAVSLRRSLPLLRTSVPFLWLDLVTAVYVAIDVMLLFRLATDVDAGIYQTPFRIVSTLVGIPLIIGTVVFPRMAMHHAAGATASSAALALCRVSLRTVLTVTLPIVVFLVTLGADMLVMFVGEAFEASRPVVWLLGLALIPTGANMVLSRLALASDREWWWARLLTLMLLLKVILIVGFIPLFDAWPGNAALGVAAALLLTEWVTAVFAMTRLGVLDPVTARRAGKLLVAGTAAITVGLVVNTWTSAVTGAGFTAAVAVYVLAAYVLALYSQDEIRGSIRWIAGRRGESKLRHRSDTE